MTRACAIAGLLALALAGCGPRATATVRTPPEDPFPGSEGDEQGRMRRELEAEILDGYTRNEMIDPDAWLGVADPNLGVVRIGVGPKDLLWTRDPEVGAGRRRWPLGNGWARSKMLELHLSDDGSVAWAFDEVSWRLDACGRSAVVPLRFTALYLRDGDRWVPVMEHISYAQPVSQLVERGLAGPALDGRMAPPATGVPIEITVERAVGARSDGEDRAAVFASEDAPLVLWPDPAHELRGSAVLTGPSLVSSFDAASVQIEGYRIGVAGGASGAAADVAWWAGTLKLVARRVDDRAAEGRAELRLRATFVLIRKGELWEIVQAHVSAPIRDDDLAAALYGAARGSDGVVRCDGPLPPPQAVASPFASPAVPSVTAPAPRAARPSGQPATKPATKTTAKPAAKPATKPATKPAATKPAAAKPAPAARPATPAAKPATTPTRPAGRAAPRPTGARIP